MSKIKLCIEVESINYCKQCEHFKITDSHYDGFTEDEDWHCTLSDRKISGCVEWRDKIEIPSWCKLRSVELGDVISWYYEDILYYARVDMIDLEEEHYGVHVVYETLGYSQDKIPFKDVINKCFLV